MILADPDRSGEVQVSVLSITHPGVWAFVRCDCGADFSARVEHLRPLPRVHIDQRGRVALSVVKDNCEDDE
jgi:hypothetical protein